MVPNEDKPRYRGVRQHGNKIRLEFSWSGKKYRPTINRPPTPGNLEEAVGIYDSIKTEIKQGVFSLARLYHYFPELAPPPEPEVPNKRFGEVAQEYMDSTSVEGSTYRTYAKTINNKWLPVLEQRPIDTITTGELKILVNSTMKWGSAKTKNNCLSVLRQVFAFAVECEYIDTNPANPEKLKGAKVQKSKPDPFDQNEAESIINHLYETHSGPGQIYGCYFEFAFFTGLRTGELLAAKWEHIDWNKGTILVREVREEDGAIRERTKTNTERYVRLNSRALQTLESLKSLTYSRDGFLFSSPRYKDQEWSNGKAPRTVFNKALEDLGIRHRRAYNTRHTYATFMLMNGIKPGYAAKQLGHSLAVFFTVYAFWLEDDSDLEMDKMEAALLKTFRKTPQLQVVQSGDLVKSSPKVPQKSATTS